MSDLTTIITPPEAAYAEEVALKLFDAYSANVDPALAVLSRRIEMRALARCLGMDLSPLPCMHPGMASNRPSAAGPKLNAWQDGIAEMRARLWRNPTEALGALAVLADSGELAELRRAISEELKPVENGTVQAVATVVFNGLPTPRDLPDLYLYSVARELSREGVSRGAAALAFLDASRSPERKFGPPVLAEILENATGRDAELRELAAVLDFLERKARDDIAAPTAPQIERPRHTPTADFELDLTRQPVNEYDF